MPRILNLNEYPYDSNPTLNDYVIGTDADQNNKTKSYRIVDIISLIDDISQPNINRVISGSINYIDALKFSSTQFVYEYEGTLYTIAPDTFILSPSDDTLNRIDIFVLDYITQEIFVSEGIPSADPAENTIDFDTQVRLTAVSIPAGASTPGNITTELVYDENAGEPGEWTAAITDEVGTGTLFLGSTDYGFSGSASSIKIDTAEKGKNKNQKNKIEFTNDAPVSSSFSSIDFVVYKQDTKEINFSIQLYNGTSSVSNTVNVTSGNYGFDDNVTNSDQFVSIPLASFNVTNSFDIISISISTNSDTTGIAFIDFVKIISGIENPPQASLTRFDELEDTPNTKVGQDGKVLVVDEATDSIVYKTLSEIGLVVTDNYVVVGTGTGLEGTVRFQFNDSTGIMSVGENDKSQGGIHIYGDGSFNGGFLRLYNAAERDTDINVWELWAGSIQGDFELKGNGSNYMVIDSKTGEFTLGNYLFNNFQTVGAGQDNYILTYDHSTGKIGLEAAPGTSNPLDVGVNDTTRGIINVYGDNGLNGGRIQIYNGALSDTTVNAWTIEGDAGGDLLFTNGVQTIVFLDDTTAGRVVLPFMGEGTLTGTPTYAAGFDSNGAFIDIELATGYVNHGAVAGTARPTDYSQVIWLGSVEPTNAVNDDIWIDTT